jgi:hypothetical protein
MSETTNVLIFKPKSYYTVILNVLLSFVGQRYYLKELVDAQFIPKEID